MRRREVSHKNQDITGFVVTDVPAVSCAVLLVEEMDSRGTGVAESAALSSPVDMALYSPQKHMKDRFVCLQRASYFLLQ
jgi:hypothetical protein